MNLRSYIKYTHVVFAHDIKTFKGNKSLGAIAPRHSFAFSCFDIMGEHDVRVFDITSHTQ